MEKLIVKNFGPIKEAEIDLTKYVVFIGDTSTGKSVLAKLISIFRNFDLYRNSNYFSSFKILLEKFNINFITKESVVHYFGNNFDLKIHNLKAKISKEIILDYDNIKSEEIEKATKELFKKLEEVEFESSLTKKQIATIKKVKSDLVKNYSQFEKSKERLKILNEDSIIYIPAERIIYSMISDSISGLLANNVALPECYKVFAGKFEVARKNIKTKEYFDFKYSFSNSKDRVFINDIEVDLTQTSSGIQSIIPLLLVLDYELTNLVTPGFTKTFIIEEPELNLFPKRQKKLIDFMIKKINITRHQIVITTHSPYILSSLDTLMLAKNTFNEHPDLREEINSIVSENKWIDYDEISVYELRNDGKVYSIKNEEFRSIDTNAIDGVSDIISEEFDKLTELRYAQ